MFSRHKILLAALDTLWILAGFNFGFWYVFASGWYHEPMPYSVYYVPSMALALVIFLAIFQLAGLYKYQAVSNSIHQIQTLLQCYAKALGIFIVTVFFMKSAYFADSRLTIGLSFVASFLLMIVFRIWLVPSFYFFLLRRGKLRKNTLILGAGEHGTMVCRFFKVNPRSYFRIVGFCDDDFNKVGTRVEGFPVLGTSYEMEGLITKYGIQEIIIAISNVRKGVMIDLIDRCKKAGAVIHVVSDLYQEVNEKMEAEECGGLRTYRIVRREFGIVNQVLKRGMDVLGSGLLLVLLSPAFMLIAWAIKRGSEGPVFYKSEVVGKDGKPFVTYKFRSMYVRDAASCSEIVKEGQKRHVEFMKDFIQGNSNGECFVKDEDRITRAGRLLRKYSLDELPQLINVFRGELSLVGPRFCTVGEYKFYKPWHKRRFRVKPGMTGLWQVRARSAVSYDNMVILDLYYIENWSVFFDIEILLRTIFVVLYGRGSRVEKPREKTLKEKIADLEHAYSLVFASQIEKTSLPESVEYLKSQPSHKPV